MLFCNIITILWWHNHTGLMHKLQTFGIIKDFLDQQRLSRLYENFPDHPDTFQIIRKPSRLSGNFLDYLETFQILQRFSRLSGNFPVHPDNIQTILKLSSLFGNFPGYLETFEIIRRPFRLSGSFPDHPDTFQTIRKLSRPSGNFRGYPKIVHAIRKLYRLFGNLQDYTETSQTVRTLSGQSRNFPAYLETFQTIRKLPSAISMVTRKNFPDTQKLSGWQCHDATMVFVPLSSWLSHDETNWHSSVCQIQADGRSDNALMWGHSFVLLLRLSKKQTKTNKTSNQPISMPYLFRITSKQINNQAYADHSWWEIW